MPGTSDANIHVALHLNQKGPEGDWHYGIATGGFEGGKVVVSRVASSVDIKKLIREAQEADVPDGDLPQ